MAYIVMACIVMAYIVMAQCASLSGPAHAMADMVMAYIVMADIVVAYIVMACLALAAWGEFESVKKWCAGVRAQAFV